MKGVALALLLGACAMPVRALPPNCLDLQSFNPEAHERNYERLEEMRARCEVALSKSADASVRKSIASVDLNYELETAHRARLAPRVQLMERTREVVAEFRSMDAGVLASLPGDAFGQALENLEKIGQEALGLRQQTFAITLAKRVDAILSTPPDISEETKALVHAFSTRVAAAAARSDQQIGAMDSLLVESIKASLSSVTRLRTGVALRSDRTTLQALADSASTELLAVQAEIAFSRFSTTVKARTVLHQASAAANAGARQTAQMRIDYLDRAYLAFWSGLPESMRKPTTEGPASSFLRQLEAVRASVQGLGAENAERRLADYIKLRKSEFSNGSGQGCVSASKVNAADIGKLGRDLSSLPTALQQLSDPGLRLFVQESVFERLEIARALCIEAR